MAMVYVDMPRRGKTPCDGCTPPNDPGGGFEPAIMRVVGTLDGMNVCTGCARDIIKSIAARFMLHDARSTADLMSFFAAEGAARKSTPRRRAAIAKRIAPPADSVDVLPAGAAPKKAKKGSR